MRHSDGVGRIDGLLQSESKNRTRVMELNLLTGTIYVLAVNLALHSTTDQDEGVQDAGDAIGVVTV